MALGPNINLLEITKCYQEPPESKEAVNCIGNIKFLSVFVTTNKLVITFIEFF